MVEKTDFISKKSKLVLIVFSIASVIGLWIINYTSFRKNTYIDPDIPAEKENSVMKEEIDHLSEFVRLEKVHTGAANSVIQCLYNLDILKDYILQQESSEDKNIVSILQEIFGIMKNEKEANLTESYRKLYALGNKGMEDDCNKYAMVFYIYTVKNLIDFNSDKISNETNDDINIFSWFIFYQDKTRSTGFLFAEFVLDLDEMKDENIENYINEKYDSGELKNSPKIFVLQNADKYDKPYIGNIILKEYIIIQEIRYKFYSYIENTSDDKQNPVYLACIHKYDDFYIIDSVEGNKKTNNQFNTPLNDICTIFYVKVDEES